MTMSVRIRKQRLILLLCLLLIIITAIVGMSWGYSSLSFDRLIPVLFGQGTFKEDFVLFSTNYHHFAVRDGTCAVGFHSAKCYPQ
jgi:iron complex transport system permease protein